MRYAGLWIALSCLILSAHVHAQSNQLPPRTNAGSASEADIQSIQQIEADWLLAERTTDPAVLERILDNEYVNLAPAGLGPGKDQLLKNFRAHAGEAPPYSLEEKDMRIYILDDTAVAAYVKIYTAKANGNVAREDTTHVFTKGRGVWKLRLSRAS